MKHSDLQIPIPFVFEDIEDIMEDLEFECLLEEYGVFESDNDTSSRK